MTFGLLKISIKFLKCLTNFRSDTDSGRSSDYRSDDNSIKKNLSTVVENKYFSLPRPKYVAKVDLQAVPLPTVPALITYSKLSQSTQNLNGNGQVNVVNPMAPTQSMINLNLGDLQPKVKKRLDLLRRNRPSTRRFTVDIASNDYLQALLTSTAHTKINVKSVSKSISDLNNCPDGNKNSLDSEIKLNTLPNIKIRPLDVPVIRAKGPEFIVQSELEPLVVDISDAKV